MGTSFEWAPALLPTLWSVRFERCVHKVVVRNRGFGSVIAPGVIAIEGGIVCPHSPDDTGHFIGQGDGGFVVADTGLSGEGPALQFS